MAITVPQGVQSAVDDRNLPTLFADQGAIGGPSGVPTGLVVTIATGTTRPVNIAAGRAVCGGALFINSSTATLNLAQNTSGTSRTDVVCAQVDWDAARTAFANAGGAANIAAASTAAQAAAGSFVAIPFGSTPVQNPGTKWQEPLAWQVVPAGATQLSGGLTDVRNTPGAQTLTLPGNFTQDATWPLQVIRGRGGVFLSGRMVRSSTILSAGTSMNFNGAAIIPAGFRPLRQAQVTCSSPAANMHWLMVNTDGTAQFTAGPQINVNDNVRIHDAYWKSA